MTHIVALTPKYSKVMAVEKSSWIASLKFKLQTTPSKLVMFKLTFATCCRHLGFLKITNTRTTIRTILLRKIQRFRPRIDKIHPSTAKSFILFHRRSSPQIFPGKIWNYHVMHISFCDWTVELMAWTRKIVVLFLFFISFFLVFFPHLLLTIFFSPQQIF